MVKPLLVELYLKLYEPTSGEIIFNGENITKFSEKKMVSLRKEYANDIPRSICIT